MAEQAWEGTTFGTGFMHRWLIKALRHTDVRLWYTFAAVCIIPFCVVFSPATHHIFSYFRHRHHYGSIKSLWKSYVNLVLFSQVVIDRFAMFAGKRLKLSVEHYDIFKDFAAKSMASSCSALMSVAMKWLAMNLSLTASLSTPWCLQVRRSR